MVRNVETVCVKWHVTPVWIFLGGRVVMDGKGTAMHPEFQFRAVAFPLSLFWLLFPDLFIRLTLITSKPSIYKLSWCLLLRSHKHLEGLRVRHRRRCYLQWTLYKDWPTWTNKPGSVWVTCIFFSSQLLTVPSSNTLLDRNACRAYEWQWSGHEMFWKRFTTQPVFHPGFVTYCIFVPSTRTVSKGT